MINVKFDLNLTGSPSRKQIQNNAIHIYNIYNNILL